ncbi:MAG: class I SAM-dependent methyltransferase [Nitrospirae bacterium]|nr:class I SAM-dependent methyltransferase [Nitrospirota bacterium]
MKSKETVEQLYGKKYVELYKQQSPLRLAKLLKYIKLNKTFIVADFACGGGMLMELIAPKVKSYIGIDFSEPSIKAANERKERSLIKNAEFMCADINKFCQNHPNTFDVGFALDFSEHVYDAELAQLLRSIRTSIRPNGKLYLHTPNAEFFLEMMKSRNFIVKQFPEHIAVRTPEQNLSILREAGFKIEHVWLIPHYNILKCLHPLSYIPTIGEYFKARILIEAAA